MRVRPVAASDCAELHDVLTQQPVRRQLFDDRTISMHEVVAIIAESCRLQNESGAGLWGLRQHHDDAFLGVVGLWPFEQTQTFELAFALGYRHWGKGLAQEAGAALIEYVRTHLRWQTLRASTDPGNGASIRTLKSLDFRDLAIVSGACGPLRVFERMLAAPSRARQPTASIGKRHA